jgi:endonuclease/exonuclease/phosphatase family metal-dependent hydrolase
VPQNRVPFERPGGYDPAQYELLLRTLQAGSRHVFGKFDPVPNAKTDTNNHGSFSTDNIGFNYDYPEASYARRAEILAEHEDYQRGYFFFLANDPRVPEDVRTRMAAWGLAKDEFTDNDHWPHQIYVREARRMVSDFVMTEAHLRGERPTPRPVGMGSYNMDSHNVQRYVAYDEEGRAYARNEGDIQMCPGGAYSIGYDALVPKRIECTNLLVPVCLSSSHIAYGSIRMEPVFMILGQSAATAAVMAIDSGAAVQDVDYAALSARLRADGQVLVKLLPMRVMAYNIKHGRGMDGRVDLERIARVIEAVKPDVVTLQEVDERCGRSGDVDEAAWLGERLGMTAIFGPFMDYDGGRYGMALLSKWPIVAWENHELPPGPEPRTVLAARLRVDRGVEVVVAGVHLYGDGVQRMAQARAMLRIFETESRPVILAGDFNSRPESPVMALLGSTWTNPDKGADRFTFDSVRPDREIDYILLRPGTRFEAPTVDVLVEPVASDHRPLVLDTELRRKGVGSLK